jgi:hypothetical protein
MVSLRRRQVIIGGLGTLLAPAALSAVSVDAPRKLVLSGRILGPDGKPLAGATVTAGRTEAATDADGRFVLTTDTCAYRVAFGGRSAEGSVSNHRSDADGIWRASFGLTLA